MTWLLVYDTRWDVQVLGLLSGSILDPLIPQVSHMVVGQNLGQRHVFLARSAEGAEGASGV